MASKEKRRRKKAEYRRQKTVERRREDQMECWNNGMMEWWGKKMTGDRMKREKKKINHESTIIGKHEKGQGGLAVH